MKMSTIKQEHIDTYNTLLSRVGFDMNMILDSIENNTYPLDFVMNIALSQRQAQARLSCWVISHYLLRGHSIEPYINQAIQFLPYTTHTGQTREILRWLTICKPNESHNLGALLDVCLNLLSDMTLPTGVKCHAINIVEHMAKQEPDIIPEFAAILSDIAPYMTVGGTNKIKKLLAQYDAQGLLV